MFVIFEGLDKAGKGTLEREFLKATNFKHIVVDRGPMGYMTFDRIFGRSTKLGDHDFIHYARKITKSNDYMIVYCVVSKQAAEERLKAHGEECQYDYEKAQKLYRDNVHRYYRSDKVIEIDTTFLPVERCVEIIVEKLKEVCGSEYY